MEKQDAINSLVNAVAKQGRHKALANTMREVVPSIAQQDYIIIDWGGKAASDAAKMAEVRGLLTNIYKANPLALLSVIFKDYDTNVLEDSEFSQIISFKDDDGAEIQVRFYSSSESEDSLFAISFTLD